MAKRGVTSPFVLALLIFFWAGAARGQTVIVLHGYDLTKSFDDQAGGAPLVPYGGTLTANGYVFGTNQGLQLPSPLPDPANYTVALDFLFDATSGYRKIADFLSRVSDSGLYTLNGNLNFYPITTSPQVDVIASQLVQVVFTRNSATSQVTGFVNGQQVITFTDNTELAVFDSSTNGMYFFMDDFATGQREASSGLATRLLFFDGPLNANQVLALSQGQLPLSVPEPSTAVLLAAGLGLVLLTSRRLG